MRGEIVEYFHMTKEEQTNRIKEFRKKKDLSVRELAAIVHTTHATISRLESGKQNLTQEWLRKLADALSVSPIDLLEPSDYVEYVSVAGIIYPGLFRADAIFSKTKSYSIPIPKQSRASSGDLIAFEVYGRPCTWYIAKQESKLVSANSIGKLFVVMLNDGSGNFEISLRSLTFGKDGLFLVTSEGEPSSLSVRLDDDRVASVWRAIAKYETL
jgi:transcriptional regulator with XRE-family HTH domain